MNKGLQLLAVVCALVCLAELSRGQGYGSGSIRPRPRPRPCGPICRLGCRNGFVIERGCPICRCRPGSIFPPILPDTRAECPHNSRQEVPRKTCFTSQWRSSSRPIRHQCGPRGFCQPDPADGPGLCCTRRRVIPRPTPGRCPRVRLGMQCIRFENECSERRPCRHGRTCCPTGCGRACRRVSTGIKY